MPKYYCYNKNYTLIQNLLLRAKGGFTLIFTSSDLRVLSELSDILNQLKKSNKYMQYKSVISIGS